MEVFFKNGHEKLGMCPSPRAILSFYPAACTFTVPVRSSSYMEVDVEALLPALEARSFTQMVWEAKDKLYLGVDAFLAARYADPPQKSIDYDDNL